MDAAGSAGHDHFLPFTTIDWIVPVSFEKEIIDHLNFVSQSGIISCFLWWWNEITWSYKRLSSQVTHIMNIYLAIGRHILKVEEPVHHWSFSLPSAKLLLPETSEPSQRLYIFNFYLTILSKKYINDELEIIIIKK